MHAPPTATVRSDGPWLDLDEALVRARRIAQEVVTPLSEEVDREGRWPAEAIAALLEAGLGGLVVGREHGGHGLGLEGLARVCEVLGGACASTGLCFGMHCVGSAVIAAKPTPDQVDRYLAPIVDGRHLTTLALSEPGTGTHFYLPRMLAEPGADGFDVSGTKTFVTNGSHADSYVISTVAPDAPPGEFSCLVIDREATDGCWGPPWHGLGMRGNDSRSLTLDGVVVPRENLLGYEGDQLWYVFNVIAPYFLTAMAGTYTGVAAAALEVATQHLGRRQYGGTGQRLAELPVLQHRLGELWAAVERTRAFVSDAARRFDAGDESALPAVLSTKAEVADAAVEVVNEAMTLTGGIAYAENGALARHLRDVRAAHVMGPTTDLLRTWTGRALLGIPLLAE